MMLEPHGSGRLKIEFAQASDPGRDPNKQVNEDSCGYAETRFGHLCVLCDGMGGHYGGKEASRTAITTIFEVFEQLDAGMLPAQALKAAIEEAGRRVYRLGGTPENRTRPGSTVVVLLLHDRGLDVAHVGDSRAYIIRSNQIYPLTRDHSMVQGMIDAGMLTEESAMGHPDSNKITRALGMKPEVDVELRPETMELFAGDVLLQSSDGLTDLALGRDILGATRQALASGSVEHACTMLVKMANDRGGHDNITVQMVRVAEVGPRTNTIPDAPQGAAAAAPPKASPPAETVQMTAVEHANPAGAAAAGRSGPLPPLPAALMAQGPYGMAPQPYGLPPPPVMPTAPDGTPGPGPAHVMTSNPPPGFGSPPASPGFGVAPTPGPTPTMNEIAAPPSKAWGSAMYPPMPNPPPGAPPGIAQYRIDAGGPASLPLPPASGRNTGAMAAMGTPLPAPAAMPQMPPPYGAMPMQVAVASPPSRGGIVFLIIGLSAVIAVLILVVVWALLLR
jgi:serine/threonine protein phosphatase PrpC